MAAYNYGIQGDQAPEWGVETWFNLPDEKRHLDLQNFTNTVIYLYCFQS